MPEWFFDWSGWIFALAAVVVGILALRMPAVRKKLGLNVTKSKDVKIKATDKTTADINVKKSKDVNIRIGDD